MSESMGKTGIDAARDGFRDASMRGLCAEGAMEVAVSAMQSLNCKS